MRVGLKYNLRGYSGKLGNMVFCSNFNYKLCHNRIFTYPKLTENHIRMREINNNLNALYMLSSEGYRQDWKRYARRNAMENSSRCIGISKQPPPAKALFVKCMWNWARANPELVDLRSVSREDVINLDSPMRRVSACIQCAWLKKVTAWESLNHEI